MKTASQTLEARRQAQIFADFKRDWWWFDKAHSKHIHELSASWEILRRTKAYRLLGDKMLAALASTGGVEKRSLIGVIHTARLMEKFRALLPQSPPVPHEIRDMIATWQNMIANGWTVDKTYVEALAHTKAIGDKSGKTVVGIPPVFGGLNQGVPVILPRQVSSRGHCALLVEWCEVDLSPNAPPRVWHICGPKGPTSTIETMHQHRAAVPSEIKGAFIAIEFSLHHPTQALKQLFNTGFEFFEKLKQPPKKTSSIVQGEEKDRGAYSRGCDFITATLNSLELIVLFDSHQPASLIKRGFYSLIRPENLKIIEPKIRNQWTHWNAGELARYAPQLTPEAAMKQSYAEWQGAKDFAKLAHQSTTRPIKPKADLDNLACADCGSFYKQNSTQLPAALPIHLQNDVDLNKRIATGLRLISSVDDLFLPLLNCAPKLSA